MSVVSDLLVCYSAIDSHLRDFHIRQSFQQQPSGRVIQILRQLVAACLKAGYESLGFLCCSRQQIDNGAPFKRLDIRVFHHSAHAQSLFKTCPEWNFRAIALQDIKERRWMQCSAFSRQSCIPFYTLRPFCRDMSGNRHTAAWPQSLALTSLCWSAPGTAWSAAPWVWVHRQHHHLYASAASDLRLARPRNWTEVAQWACQRLQGSTVQSVSLRRPSESSADLKASGWLFWWLTWSKSELCGIFSLRSNLRHASAIGWHDLRSLTFHWRSNKVC